jgi:Fur family ferric uptake transcriptional regulator
MRPTEKKIAVALSERGYKLTPQRRAIIRVIATSSDHLTPAAVYERVYQDHPHIGLVTVYRTLEILAQIGFARRIHGEGGCHSYVAALPGHRHHLVCSNCGTVIDFPGCDLSELERSLSRQTGFKIESHLLEFLGRCQDCQKKALI